MYTAGKSRAPRILLPLPLLSPWLVLLHHYRRSLSVAVLLCLFAGLLPVSVKQSPFALPSYLPSHQQAF